MSINVREIKNESKGTKQEPLEAGDYPVRVLQIIDLGVQKQRPYKGEPKPPCHEISITYELLDEFCKDEDGNEEEDRPRVISEIFPLRSLDSDLAKSTKRYFAIDPEEKFGGDFSQLISIPVKAVISKTNGKGDNADKVYNNIISINAMRPKEAATAPELINKPKVFLLDSPDLEVFNSFPDWLKDKIKSNLDFEGSKLEELLNGNNEKEEGESNDEEPWV